MAVELRKQAAPIEVTRKNITTLVQEHINSGMQPKDASERVFSDLERQGKLADLARMLGASATVGSIWQDHNKTARPANLGVSFRELLLPTPEGHPTPIMEPSPRVVAVERIRDRSLLDGMYRIGGEWVTLRFMDKSQCRRMFDQYRNDAVASEHNARYFRAIEAALGRDETVGQKFDDAALIRLYDESKPPANAFT